MNLVLSEPYRPTAAIASTAPSVVRVQTLRPIMLLSTAAFCASACLRVTDPLLPEVATTFAVSTSRASVIVTAFALAYGLSQIIYGPIGDRFGKYSVITLAVTLSAVVVAAAATAHSLAALVMFRLVAGLTTAAILPLSLAYVGDAVPYHVRQTVLARILSGQLLGVICGQSLGGILVQFVSWRVVFVLLGATFGVVASLLWLELRSPRVVQIRAPTPLELRRLLTQYIVLIKAPRPRTVLLAIAIEGGVFFGTLAYLSAFLRQSFGFDFVRVGLVLGCFGIGGLGYSLCARWIVPLAKERGMIRLGGVILAAGLITLARLPAYALPPVMAALGFALYMFHNTLQTNATQMAVEARGAAVSLFYSCFFLGQAIGAATLGLAIDQFGYGAVFASGGIVLLMLGLWASHVTQPQQQQ
jgi:MFS transporter, YNFM family, putative membrane transport protein